MSNSTPTEKDYQIMQKIRGESSESELNDLIYAIQHLAKLLEVEDHELLDCIEGRMISELATKPLWLIINGQPK